MDAHEHLRAGRLDEAMACLQDAVRNQPDDVRQRIFLFQLCCVMGQWDRALNQLKVVADLDAEAMLLARIFERVIRCELLRADVFAGARSPIIFGEPPEWVGWMVRALQLSAEGKGDEASELRGKALDAAPATPGRRGDARFEWIADADSRLGPILEAIIDGKYYWVPFCRLKELRVESPKDLRDLVWAPANFALANGGETSGFVPARYAGTESSADGGLRLARRTEWIEKPGGVYAGLGQRMLTTHEAEYSVLELGRITLEGA